MSTVAATRWAENEAKIIQIFFGTGATISNLPVCEVVRGPGELDMASALMRGYSPSFTVENDDGCRYTYETCGVHMVAKYDGSDETLGICITARNPPSLPGQRQRREAETVYFVGIYTPQTRKGYFHHVDVPEEPK